MPFSLLERSYLSLRICCFFEGVSIINLKTAINYNNILIKVQFNCIATVSASEAHSKTCLHKSCIKVLKSTLLYLHLGRHS